MAKFSVLFQINVVTSIYINKEQDSEIPRKDIIFLDKCVKKWRHIPVWTLGRPNVFLVIFFNAFGTSM